MITGLFHMNIAGDEVLKYVRDKNLQTGEEKILEPHELVEPYHIEVGDDEAYKVTLLSDQVHQYKVTY